MNEEKPVKRVWKINVQERQKRPQNTWNLTAVKALTKRDFNWDEAINI